MPYLQSGCKCSVNVYNQLKFQPTKPMVDAPETPFE